MNQNLEQIRAKNALDCSSSCPETCRDIRDARQRMDRNEGDCLSGYPSLIINNGLLAALAFSLEKEKQHVRVANAIAYHLHNIGLVAQGAPSATALRDALVKADSHTLRRATAEALAFLAYLKRFAK